LLLRRHLDTDLGHSGDIVLVLTIMALAVWRATAQPQAFKFLLATGASDVEAIAASRHWSAIAPATDYRGALFIEGRIIGVEPIPAPFGAKPAAAIDHAVAAAKAFGDVDCWLAGIGAQEIALDYFSDV
jgi:hypothetical protein